MDVGQILFRPLESIYVSLVSIFLCIQTFVRRWWKTSSFLALVLLSFNIKVTRNFYYHIFEAATADFPTKLQNSIQYYNENGRKLYSRYPHPLAGHIDKPDVYEEQTRYIGEDARFTCRLLVVGLNTSTPHMNQIIWKKDGDILHPDKRHIITWRFTRLENDTVGKCLYDFEMFSTLTIFLIEQSDFGVYTCYMPPDFPKKLITESSQTKTSDDQASPYIAEVFFTNIYMELVSFLDDSSPATLEGFYTNMKLIRSSVRDFGRDELSFLNKGYVTSELLEFALYTYYLQKTIATEITTYVARLLDQLERNCEFRLIEEKPRTDKLFVAPGTLLSFRTYYRHLGNPEDITVLYKLNGQNPSDNNSKCSIFVFLYYILTSEKLYSPLLALLYVDKIINIPLHQDHWKCISPTSYGIQNITITSKTRFEGSERLAEFTHPLKLDVRPKLSDLFNFYDPVTNQTHLTSNKFDVDCWTGESGLGVAKCLSLHNTIYDNAQKVIYADLRLFVVVLICICLFLYYMVKLICFLLKFPGKAVPLETLANLPLYQDVQLKYHLFISIHERDYLNLRDFIAELESRDFQLFVTCRDITPGESMISATGTAIMQSASCMVVASADYLQDPGLNNLQINMILSKATPRNYLVLKLNECRVSEIFGEGFTLVDATKITSYETHRTILRWLNSQFYSTSYFQKIMTCMRVHFKVPGKMISLKTLGNLPYYRNSQLKYHLYIAIDERDYLRLRDYVAELESRGLKLFVTGRDLTPGEPIISAIETAMMHSVSYMFVASTDYLTGHELNNLQITMMTPKATPEHVLVLGQNQFHVPGILGGLYILVDATKFTSYETYQTIRSWLIPEHCLISYIQIVIIFVILLLPFVIFGNILVVLYETLWRGEPLNVFSYYRIMALAIFGNILFKYL